MLNVITFSHVILHALRLSCPLSYLVFWEKSFALQSSYCLRRRLCCDIKFTNSSNKTQFYDRWIIILFNNKDKVLNNQPLVPSLPTQTFFSKVGGGLMCVVYVMPYTTWALAGVTRMGLPSSGQDVVYSCLLCTSPPYPAPPQLSLVLAIYIQYHLGYLDISHAKDFLFWSSISWEKLVCIGDTQLIDTAPGPQICWPGLWLDDFLCFLSAEIEFPIV